VLREIEPLALLVLAQPQDHIERVIDVELVLRS
jgi:hypothetical protein